MPTLKQSDERFRQFFWNNFIQEDDTHFYRHTKPDPSAVQGDVSRAHSVPFTELAALDPQDIPYKTVMGQHKDFLRIVATAERQRSAVLGNAGEAVSSVSAQAFQILQNITAARELGATQAQLAKQHDIDPRSMFHFLKVLIDMKLIVKIPVTTEGKYTLLCLHNKFAKKNAGYIGMNSEETFSSAGRQVITGDGGKRFEGLLKTDSKKVSYYSGLIKQKLTDILGRAKNQIMMIEDIHKALDLTDMNTVQNRWFNRQIELLCKLKYIKRVQVEGLNRCIQLLRPYGANLSVDQNEKDQLNLRNVIADDTPQSGICIDTSIEHQVYKLIVDSRKQGIIAKPIPDSEKALVNRVVEFVGRERRYRYYSQDACKEGITDDHKDLLERTKAAPSAASSSGSKKPKATTQAPTLSDTTAVHHLTTNSTLDSVAMEGSSSTSEGGSATSSRSPVPALVSTSTKASVSATPEKFISVEVLRRRRILMSIIDDKRMVELHSSLVMEYQTVKARLYPDQELSSVIDRKTLYRTISILEQEGLVKLFKINNIPSPGGGMVAKTFVLHPDVNPESEEVKSFVKDCSSRHLLFGALANKPMQRVEKVTLEVETLDEMQQRLGGQFYKGPNVPFAEVGAVKPKEHESKIKVYAQDGGDYSTEYGWIHAKMMRALVFHRFLLDKMEAQDKRLFTFSSRANVFNTAPIFEVLPLRVFLIVVGFNQEPTADNREYLDEHKESSAALCTLPAHMRHITLPNTNFKRRLREVLEILDALGIVSPLKGPPNGQDPLKYAHNHLVLNTQYELHLNVRAPLHSITPELIDEDLAGRKTYDVMSQGGCKEFWTDLQATASSMKVPDESLVAKSSFRPWAEIRSNFLRNLCNRRIWADSLRVTPIQRETLMKYVNKTTRFVPNIKDARMSTIIKETGLPIDHIVQFYKAVAMAWYNDPLTRDNSGRTRLTRLSKVGAAPANLKSKNDRVRKPDQEAEDYALVEVSRKGKEKEVMLRGDATQNLMGQKVSTMAKGLAVSFSSARSVSDTSTPEKLNVLASDATVNDESVKTPGGYAVGQTKKPRAARVPWTDTEDDKMLLAMAITRYISRALNLRFSWHGVARALDGHRTPEICRHRYDKLMKETTLSNRVESYIVQFGQAFPEISQRFSVDPNLQFFDPRPIMTYFRPTLEPPAGFEAAQSDPLLADPKDIEKLYLVRHSEPYSKLYVEDRLHAEMSLPRRMAVLTQVPATLRSSIEKELDEGSDDLGKIRSVDVSLEKQGDHHVVTVKIREERLAQEHVILGVIKAIYSMPPEKRTKELTRAILESFPYDRLKDTCSLAKDWKVLSSVKSMSYRIPGQKVRRAERFTLVMAGSVPRKMTLAAAEVDEYFRKAKERLFQVDAGPSDMMVLLNEIAMDGMEVSMRPPSDETGATGTDDHGVILHFDIQLKSKRAPFLTATRAAMTGRRKDQEGTTASGVDPRGDGIQLLITQSGSSTEDVVDPWAVARKWSARELAEVIEACQSNDTGRLYKIVYDIISCSEGSGMLLQDIKDAVVQAEVTASDQELMRCIQTLEGGDKAVLMKVGMAQRRYVVFGWHQAWTVDYRTAVGRAGLGEEGFSAAKDPSACPWNCLVPRMWRSLDGGFDKATFEKALHAVLTYIVDRPGVSKGALLTYFHKIVLGTEMEELLEELEERGAIEARHGIQPKASSLFSKKGMFVRCDRDTIDARKVTNLFPQPSYYLYIDTALVDEAIKGKAPRRRRRPRQGPSAGGLRESMEGDLDEYDEEDDDDEENDGDGDDEEGYEDEKEDEEEEDDEELDEDEGEDERLSKKLRSG
ncbi:General transcription factor 3C polypeptide 1 [Haplosporangium gracile]|nr:General transcription factor 3C polypeptide 1 [Haplosporangium gracile]